jgi:hypothetical protein
MNAQRTILSKSFLAGSTSLDETHAEMPSHLIEFWVFKIIYIMKRDKIIYWVATGLVAAGMAMSAFMYLTKNPALVASFQQLGFPVYFISILGTAKLLGAIVLVTPAGERLKEWAYAGFLFTFGGAIWTHVVTGTPWVTPAVFLLVLAVSYVFKVRAHSKVQDSTTISTKRAAIA